LALCLERSIGTLLTDGTAARLAATSLNLTTHGTLGLLIRSVRRGLRSPTEVLALLNSIAMHSTLHIRPSLLDDVIRQVQREWNDPGA
jgi:predicted nucleic acid-binding protein